MSNAEKVNDKHNYIVGLVDKYVHCKDADESNVLMARLAEELISLRRMTLYVESEEEFFDEFVED